MKILETIRRKYYERRLRKGIEILENIDTFMKEAGYHRSKRRQFWRDFIKRQEMRAELYGNLR